MYCPTTFFGAFKGREILGAYKLLEKKNLTAIESWHKIVQIWSMVRRLVLSHLMIRVVGGYAIAT